MPKSALQVQRPLHPLPADLGHQLCYPTGGGEMRPGRQQPRLILARGTGYARLRERPEVTIEATENKRLGQVRE